MRGAVGIRPPSPRGDGRGRVVRVASLLQNPTPYHGVISPSPPAPRASAGPRKTRCFCIGASLLTSTWSGALWARFCLPQAPRASADPRKTRRFCIGTSVLMQKRRVFSGPAEARDAWGRQKRAQVNGSTSPRLHESTGQRVIGSMDQRVDG